jgi:RNA polymerase sigma factor (sigma-70 family)
VAGVTIELYVKIPGINRKIMAKKYAELVDMYDEKIFVNTETKEGYDKVLKKIDPLLCKWATKTYISGYHFNDIKQELSIMIIEGINAFDPDKKVKLSSFLHNHLKNKLISKLKSANKLSNDAYGLSEEKTKTICSCGGLFSEKGKVNVCKECGNEYGPVYRNSREELVFSIMPKRSPSTGEEYLDFESSLATSDGMFSSGKSEYDKVDLDLAIEKLSAQVDVKTRTILKMVCLEGFSISDAAKHVGITGWAASMRLKKIKANKILNDILEDLI